MTANRNNKDQWGVRKKYGEATPTMIKVKIVTTYKPRT